MAAIWRPGFDFSRQEQTGFVNRLKPDALMRIEGFRSLDSDIEAITSKSGAVKKTRRDKGGKMTPKEKKELSDEGKEYKSMRKQIQEKLIKFATHIPLR